MNHLTKLITELRNDKKIDFDTAMRIVIAAQRDLIEEARLAARDGRQNGVHHVTGK